MKPHDSASGGSVAFSSLFDLFLVRVHAEFETEVAARTLEAQVRLSLLFVTSALDTAGICHGIKIWADIIATNRKSLIWEIEDPSQHRAKHVSAFS